MPPLISIVIPAYNSASRIKLALESVIAQDYQELEIVLVDDASLDNTLSIARKVLSNCGRNFQIHSNSSNSGVSASRNIGMNLSHGDYISFIDSDDIISKNFISKLYASISKYNAQFSFCNLSRKIPDESKIPRRKLSTSFAGEDIIFTRTISPVCCLYEKKFLVEHAIFFHEGCSAGEDIEFQIKALCLAKRVSELNECLYFYVQHENMGSIRDNNTQEKKLTRYEHNTQAQIRTAEFLLKHAKSNRVKFFTKKLLLPQNLIRQFTIYAAKNDIASYNLLLNDKENLKILRGALSFYVLRIKAELFFKALIILFFPKLYCRMRAKL